LFPAAPVIGEVDLRCPDVSLSWCELAKGTVRPGFAAAPQAFGQYPVQVVLIDDQQPPGRAGDDPNSQRLPGQVRPGGLNRLSNRALWDATEAALGRRSGAALAPTPT
jgi:hypothetical protein